MIIVMLCSVVDQPPMCYNRHCGLQQAHDAYRAQRTVDSGALCICCQPGTARQQLGQQTSLTYLTALSTCLAAAQLPRSHVPGAAASSRTGLSARVAA